MRIRASTICALAVLALASPVSAQDIIGTATVIDGDTLRIGATTIRLYGIDAPEKRQTCRSANGTVWHCGLLRCKSFSFLMSPTWLREQK